MLVKEILKRKPGPIVTATPQMPIRRAMELLIENQVSCLPVEDENEELVGIISDKDIFRLLYAEGEAASRTAVSDAMSKEIIVGLPDDEIGYIAGIMTNNRVRHVPIVHGKKLVGLLSVGDIVKTQMANYEIENRYLRQYIDGSYPG